LSKNLIIYYSRKGQNYVNGRIESLTKGNTKFVQNLFKRQLAEIYLRLKPSMVIRQIIMHVQQRQRRSMKTIHVRSLKHILKTSAGMTIFSFVVRAGVEHIQWQYFR